MSLCSAILRMGVPVPKAVNESFMGTKRESRGGEQHTSKKQTSTFLLELLPASLLWASRTRFLPRHQIRSPDPAQGQQRACGGTLICRTITAVSSWLPKNKCSVRPHASVLHHSGEDHTRNAYSRRGKKFVLPIWVESTERNREFEGGGSRWQKSLLVSIYL